MTTATPDQQAAPTAVQAPDVPRGNPWMPTFGGIWLVARIEMLRRRPSKKGYIFYGLLFGFIMLLSALATAAAGNGKTSGPLELILIMILGTGYLIGPSLSATAINGDSTDGVLAPMQMTRLTAGDLAIGKLLASWAVSILALVTTAPFLWYATVRSGWTGLELLTVLGVILFLVLVATATGLAWSSIAARNAVSVALTHVTSGFFGLGTLILFAFTTPLVTETVTVSDTSPNWDSATQEQLNDPYFNGEGLECITQTYELQWTHTERTAWLMLLNPVVVIGESSPIINPETYEEDGRAAPGLFAIVHQSVASAVETQPRPADSDWCAYPDTGSPDAQTWEQQQTDNALAKGQPWLGLGFYAAVFLGSMVIAVQRLRVPYKKLRVGTRVA